jgi:hypothetical protein
MVIMEGIQSSPRRLSERSREIKLVKLANGKRIAKRLTQERIESRPILGGSVVSWLLVRIRDFAWKGLKALRGRGKQVKEVEGRLR